MKLCNHEEVGVLGNASSYTAAAFASTRDLSYSQKSFFIGVPAQYIGQSFLLIFSGLTSEQKKCRE